MKTMNSVPSNKSVAITGAITAPLAFAFGALTGTGVAGCYAFALVAILVYGLVHMWPGRGRFVKRSSLQSAARRDDHTEPSHRPRAL